MFVVWDWNDSVRKRLAIKNAFSPGQSKLFDVRDFARLRAKYSASASSSLKASSFSESSPSFIFNLKKTSFKKFLRYICINNNIFLRN